jgi:hypothetical protein
VSNKRRKSILDFILARRQDPKRVYKDRASSKAGMGLGLGFNFRERNHIPGPQRGPVVRLTWCWFPGGTHGFLNANFFPTKNKIYILQNLRQD